MVVCLVVNAIEAIVHPRHPLRREERSLCPATMLLEMLLEKLRRTSPLPMSMGWNPGHRIEIFSLSEQKPKV